MSSSEQPAFQVEFQQSTDNDATMMEAPDSPPETSHAPAANSSQPSNSQQANSNRVNGESSAKVNHGPPGSSWTTKKFQEEYERANTQVLDQNWDSTRYGDPLME